MAKENVSFDFRLKKLNETTNFSSGDIKHNYLTNGKHKKVCRSLDYLEHFLIFIRAVSGCVSISTFVSLVGVAVGITCFVIGLKTCPLTAGIKKCQVSYQEKIENSLVSQTKLNTTEVLISRTLIDSYINRDEYVSVNNAIRGYNEIKVEIEKPKNAVAYTI